MSIRVTIEQTPGRKFRRELLISRIETVETNESLHDEVHRYAVEYRGGGQRTWAEAEFNHRWGDDLLTLVSEAVDALGGRGDAAELDR